MAIRGKLPIGDFRKAWNNACKAASLGAILPHDMRRSCARNLVRSGLVISGRPETTAETSWRVSAPSESRSR